VCIVKIKGIMRIVLGAVSEAPSSLARVPHWQEASALVGELAAMLDLDLADMSGNQRLQLMTTTIQALGHFQQSSQHQEITQCGPTCTPCDITQSRGGDEGKERRRGRGGCIHVMKLLVRARWRLIGSGPYEEGIYTFGNRRVSAGVVIPGDLLKPMPVLGSFLGWPAEHAEQHRNGFQTTSTHSKV
jgi:hypothetical protein